MSDSHRNGNEVVAVQSSGDVGIVDHQQHLSDNIGALYMADEFADLTLLVNGESFPAHKVILAARSQYFRAMLFGGMRESHANQIELVDVNSLSAFKHLLRYVYKGDMQLATMKEDLILDVLGLTHQYGFTELEGMRASRNWFR